MVCWIDILMYKKEIKLLKIENNSVESVWKGQLWLSFGILPKQNITKGVIPCGKVLPYGPLIRGCMAPSVQCSVLVAWKNLLLYVWCTLNWNKLPSESESENGSKSIMMGINILSFSSHQTH